MWLCPRMRHTPLGVGGSLTENLSYTAQDVTGNFTFAIH